MESNDTEIKDTPMSYCAVGNDLLRSKFSDLSKVRLLKSPDEWKPLENSDWRLSTT